MKFYGHELNLKPSPHDDRDYMYATPLGAAAKVPDFDLGPGRDKNQEDSSVCTNASMAKLLEDFHPDDVLSMTFLYGRREDGDYMGEGEVIREMLKDCYHAGLCLEDEMIKLGTVAECVEAYRALPDDVKERAKLRRIEGYYRLSNKPQYFLEIMHKLKLKTILGIPIYDRVWREAIRSDGKVYPPEAGDEMAGGHAIMCSGKEDGWTIVPNTWGGGIPQDGVQYLHEDYPIWECWLPIPYIPTVIKMVLGSRQYSINGKAYEMDTQPDIVNGRLRVPLRFLMESLRYAHVSWEADERLALIQYGGRKLYFYEGAERFDDGWAAATIKYDSGVTNFINSDGRMLVPVRKPMEYLGFTVDFNESSKVITISK